MDNDKVISTLNGLIETCRDGQEGFKEASENATSPELKRFFLEASRERARCVGELQQEVRTLGGNPENTGSTAGALHRVWIDIKGTLTGKDDASILNEAERGEDSAVKAFEDALKEGLPANARSTVQKQFSEIKLTHDRVKQMRDAKSATVGRK